MPPPPSTGFRRATNRIDSYRVKVDYEAGKTTKEMAEEYGVSPQAVNKRIRELNLTTAAAIVQPYASRRWVNTQIDAFEHMNKSLGKVQLLMDACDRYLRDPNNPDQYDVGPHAHEVQVTYDVAIPTEKGERIERRKKPLSELLAGLETDDGARIVCNSTKGEFKHSDPRDLILKTAQETRSTIETAATLVRMLADAKAMQMFREAMLSEIGKVSPEVATAIAEAVRRSIVLSGALDGSPGLFTSTGT